MTRYLLLPLSLLTLGLVVLVALILLAHFGGVHIASSAEIPGLNAEVVLNISDDGIVTLDTDNIEDLFASLGYVHALQNAWPMTLRQRISAGMLGRHSSDPKALELDRHIRMLGIPLAARNSYSALPDSLRRLLDAYANGVNTAFDANGLSRDETFVLLGLEVEPWEPWHTLAVEHLIAYLGTSPTINDEDVLAYNQTPELARFLTADSLLRDRIGISGLEHSFGYTDDRLSLVRMVTGSSAFPLIQPIGIHYRGEEMLVGSIAGSTILPAGWTATRSWILNPTGIAEIHISWESAPDPKFDRLILSGDREALVKTRQRESTLFIDLAVAAPPRFVAEPDTFPDPEPEMEEQEPEEVEVPVVDSEPEPEPIPEPVDPPPTPLEPDTVIDDDPQPEPEPVVEPEPEADPEIEDEPEVEPEPEADPEPVPEPEQLPAVETDTLQAQTHTSLFRFAAFQEEIRDEIEPADDFFEEELDTDIWWVLSWNGLAHSTDLPAWLALLEGQIPVFNLFDSGIAEGSFGDPSLSVRLALPDSLLPAPSAIGDDAYSVWAARIAPPLIQAIGPPDSLVATARSAAAFLSGWDFEYAPDAIAGTIFDHWMHSYRSITGHLPNPDSLQLYREAQVDTLYIRFEDHVAQLIDLARSRGNPLPSLADTLDTYPERADSLVAAPRTQMIDSYDLSILRRAYVDALETIVDTYGPPGASWRWDRTSVDLLHFSTSDDPLGRFQSVELRNGGHPTAINWGSSILFPEIDATASWTGWRSSSAADSVFVRFQNPAAFPPNHRQRDEPTITIGYALSSERTGRKIRLIPADEN